METPVFKDHRQYKQRNDKGQGANNTSLYHLQETACLA